MNIKIAVCQLAPRVADFAYNTDLLLNELGKIEADIAVTGELYICGYSPMDLLLRADFLAACHAALQNLAKQIWAINPALTVITGAPCAIDGQVFNGAYKLYAGNVELIYKKQELPNYGVFDELRYFCKGQDAGMIEIKNHSIGVLICEDLWTEHAAAQAKAQGAQLLISLNASPYRQGRFASRLEMLQRRAFEQNLPIIYVNNTGAVDDLIFDGNSFAIAANGELKMRAAHCENAVKHLEFNGELHTFEPLPAAVLGVDAISQISHQTLAENYRALKMALKMYVVANGFSKVVLGLSGGIDSALVLALAVDALGADHVHAVMLPSQYTSQMSLEDAATVAQNFGVRYELIGIDASVESVKQALQQRGQLSAIAVENMQARMRGLMLMSLSNDTGAMLLTTGNKSEYAVGYSTLYGDMCGGFAPLKDVYKTQVFALCRWRNLERELIPKRIILRAPSAELAPNQTDQDSLPPYEILDAILTAYIENKQSYQQIIAQGFAEDIVKQTLRRLHLNEFKRRQSATGARISTQAFERERRVPISSAFDKYF